MFFECDNPLFGRTLNPHSPNHTCGGSSGGEAVLAAMRATPIGIGSDSGGSARIPAPMSGCVGYKPTSGRMPMCSNEGQEGIPVVLGMLAPTVSNVEFVSAALAAQGRVES